MLVQLAALGAVGYFGYRYLTRESRNRRAAFANGQPAKIENPVRDAGPQAMRDPVPDQWEKQDQRSDESFPASDPPGTY